jgi:hypothetical protein
MADEIISASDLGLDKSALQETFVEAAASALAVSYLAVQSLFQVRAVCWGVQYSSTAADFCTLVSTTSARANLELCAVLQKTICFGPGA